MSTLLKAAQTAEAYMAHAVISARNAGRYDEASAIQSELDDVRAAIAQAQSAGGETFAVPLPRSTWTLLSPDGTLMAGSERELHEHLRQRVPGTGGTLNDVPLEDFDRPARELHEVLLRAGYVRSKHGWAFNGWTANGVPVRHRIKVEGYVRAGAQVERERAVRAAAGLPCTGDSDDLPRESEENTP